MWLFSLTFLLSVDLHPQWWLPDVWQNFFGLLPFPGWCRYPVTLSTFKEFHLKVWHALRSITAWFFIICSHPQKLLRTHVCWSFSCVFILSGKLWRPSHDLTPKGSQGREIPVFQGNLGYLGWWNIIIRPDIILFWNFAVSPLLLNTNDLVVSFLSHWCIQSIFQ